MIRRPPRSTRTDTLFPYTTLFRSYPPHSGFPPTSGIRDIAARALQRAGISGIAHRGSHIFRHSLATELLRSGAVLTQISQVLRHKDHNTTRSEESRVGKEGVSTCKSRWSP